MPDYTTVVAVDDYHLKQLAATWPTWAKHKPGLLSRPMLVIYDSGQVEPDQIRQVVDHPDMRMVRWPPSGTAYAGGSDKWTNPQRYKMLAAFVHVPGVYVQTDYWLKLDTDVVATGNDDWVDERWFAGRPAIVGQRWSFTKPGDQLLWLDRWVDSSLILRKDFSGTDPLGLVPRPGSDRVGHKRIISWCCFFLARFTARAAALASSTCGAWQLPVPSQDGYLWYSAKRRGLGIVRINVKSLGWQHWSTMGNVLKHAKEAMDA